MKSNTPAVARPCVGGAALRVAALALGLTLPQPAVAGTGATDCALEPGPERSVAEVVDGETVRLDDGKFVRLLGILAPRAFDAGAPSGEWLPESRARQQLVALVAGRTVALAFAGPRTDRYGRVRAHVHVGTEAARRWVQGALVADGIVRAQPEPGDAACAAALTAIERGAAASGRGLWAEAAYRVRAADRPSELLRYRGTYQLVQGRVARMRQSGSVSLLELENSEAAGQGRARPARGAVRVTWRRANVELSPEWSRSTIVGSEVVVRGWVVGGYGPEIKLVAPAQLEIARDGPGDGQSRIDK